MGQSEYTEIDGFNNDLTQAFGSILYGIYHFATIIVLLNMLIASMAQSLERILVKFYF